MFQRHENQTDANVTKNHKKWKCGVILESHTKYLH